MDETTDEALLLSKVLGVGFIRRLVGLVLDQCGDQVQDGVHLWESTERRFKLMSLVH